MTAQELKAAAKGFGADLVGIASIDVLRDLPREINPLAIHSRAR